jgi:hypothetical protein
LVHRLYTKCLPFSILPYFLQVGSAREERDAIKTVAVWPDIKVDKFHLCVDLCIGSSRIKRCERGGFTWERTRRGVGGSEGVEGSYCAGDPSAHIAIWRAT